MYAADQPAGWALIPEPNDKERRFCKKMHIEIIEAGVDELLAAAGFADASPEPLVETLSVGC
jgi:hypothetical protein